MSALLLVIGVALLSMALRSFAHPVLHKLGSFCILGTSFLIGYLLTDLWQVGLVCAGSWLMLPWLEILTRVRRMRLPMEKPLKHRLPPSRDLFPMLGDLTGEFEDEGFELVEDAGWDWEDQRQFFRLMYKAEERVLATICLVDQDDIAFYYLRVTSRRDDGTAWITWNNPFSSPLKEPPQRRINRVRGDYSALDLLGSHRAFLARTGAKTEQLAPFDPEEIQTEMQRELQAQIAHNISAGLLLPEPEGKVRYSWRGLFFIWFQFLRDFVRLS